MTFYGIFYQARAGPGGQGEVSPCALALKRGLAQLPALRTTTCCKARAGRRRDDGEGVTN
ncbi:hypothetical protein J6590_068534 [Homalodisca vitripennis]|nr:hypothetical protein J6590_068534 [Homalodisca vitripennis]